MEEEKTNYRKPEGKAGKTLLDKMDSEHTPVSLWAINHIDLNEDDTVLDIGCGSGLNLKRLHQKSPKAKSYGIDYSKTSVEKSKELNLDEVDKGQIEIIEADVQDMPFEDETFDIITAFETVYFWPSITESFKEVKRTLKSDGKFCIILDANGIYTPRLEEIEKEENCKFYTDTQLTEYLQQAQYSKITVYNRKRKENRKVIRTITRDYFNEEIVDEQINDNYDATEELATPEWLCIICEK